VAKLSFLRDGPNSAFGWQKIERSLQLNSLNWQGHDWHHVVWVGPNTEHRTPNTCLLFISGDLVDEPDQWTFNQLQRSRLPIAMLFGIPNQPLFDLREDDLIAHSFEQAMVAGDQSWPIVFAMATAVIRCMDALQEAFGFQNFVLAGASKRGWTAWLAALAGDPRVGGLCSIIFDNLNVVPQMQQQLLQWGSFSPKLDDYTRRHLQAMMDDPAGLELAQAVDPYSYLSDLQCPVHLVHGANDPFWCVDATTRYWDALPSPKSLRVLPNTGHTLTADALASVSSFAQACAEGETLPQWSAHLRGDEIIYTGPDPDQILIHYALSDDLHFDDKEWHPGLELPWVEGKNIAYTIEARFGGVGLNTLPRIVHGSPLMDGPE